MAYIKLSTPEQGVVNGMQLTFQAPCDGKGISGVTLDGQDYQFVSTIGDAITCSNDMFKKDAYITITIDTNTKKAFIVTNNEAYARENVARIDGELATVNQSISNATDEITKIKNGTTTVSKASSATSADNAMKLNGQLYTYYATADSVSKIAGGTTKVGNASNADNASKLNNQSASYYATKASVDNIVGGTTTVAKATNANKASDADKLGGQPSTHYASASSVTNVVNGTTIVAKATAADNATKLDGQPASYYATNAYVDSLIQKNTDGSAYGDGKVMRKAYSAYNANYATRAGSADTANNATYATSAGSSATAGDSDKLGGKTPDQYAPAALTTNLTSGALTVGKATYANSAGVAENSTKFNGQGASYYATKASVDSLKNNVENGTTVAKTATNATNATNLTGTIKGVPVDELFDLTSGNPSAKTESAKNVTDAIGGMALTDIFTTSEGELTETVKKAGEAIVADRAKVANTAITATTATTANQADILKKTSQKGQFANGKFAITLNTNGLYMIGTNGYTFLLHMDDDSSISTERLSTTVSAYSYDYRISYVYSEQKLSFDKRTTGGFATDTGYNGALVIVKLADLS